MAVYLTIFAVNTHFTHIHDLIADTAAGAFDWLFTQVISWLKNSAAEMAVLILCLFLLRLLLSLLPFPLDSTTPVVELYCDHSLNTSTQHNAETTGLSTGCIVFDTQRADGNLKMQAANSFKQGDIRDGLKTLDKAHQQDSVMQKQ